MIGTKLAWLLAAVVAIALVALFPAIRPSWQSDDAQRTRARRRGSYGNKPIRDANTTSRSESGRLYENSTLACRVSFQTTLLSTSQPNRERRVVVCLVLRTLNDTVWQESDEQIELFLPRTFYEQHVEDIERGQLILSLDPPYGGSNILPPTLGGPTDRAAIVLNATNYNVLHSSTFNNSATLYRHLWHRRLTSTVPRVLTIAMIRVSTLDSSPHYTAQQLSQHWSSSRAYNFVNQFAACSFGQMQWKLVHPNPTSASTSGHVVDVMVPQLIDDFHTDFMSLVLAAQARLKEQWGWSPTTSLASVADKVLFCLPPGTGDWAGSASLNHWRIQINDEWCLSLSTAMHELGHSLGLRHAGISNSAGVVDEYGDGVGYMGGSQIEAERPRKCFGAYNMVQLGWFKDQTLHWNPLLQGPALIQVASIVDQDQIASLPRTNSDAVVATLVNLGNDVYLHYNVAEKCNAETQLAPNRITVTRPSAKGSTHFAGLAAKESYLVENFAGTNHTLRIEACDKGKHGSAKIMWVGLSLVNTTILPLPSVCDKDATLWPLTIPSNPPTTAPSRHSHNPSVLPPRNRTSDDDTNDESSIKFPLLYWILMLLLGRNV